MLRRSKPATSVQTHSQIRWMYFRGGGGGGGGGGPCSSADHLLKTVSMVKNGKIGNTHELAFLDPTHF